MIIRGTVAGDAHILISSSAPQTIKYATIRYMGPDIPGFQPDTDVTGRYPLHFHHSSGSRGSIVEGVVVRDSGNRAFVPHGSNGVTFNNTIAYDVVGAAYWWDPPSPANPGLHESDDIVYNGAVAAKVWASESQIHRSAAFELGAGVNPTVINSVAVGMQGGGKDNSGFFWPAAAEGVWTFVNNRAHNNNAHGIFVWQNTNIRHVINGFTAYFNMKSGVQARRLQQHLPVPERQVAGQRGPHHLDCHGAAGHQRRGDPGVEEHRHQRQAAGDQRPHQQRRVASPRGGCSATSAPSCSRRATRWAASTSSSAT